MTSPAFSIGDVVQIVKYPEWEKERPVIVEITRCVEEGVLTDDYTYSTWIPGEGATTGWRAKDLKLIKANGEDRKTSEDSGERQATYEALRDLHLALIDSYTEVQGFIPPDKKKALYEASKKAIIAISEYSPPDREKIENERKMLDEAVPKSNFVRKVHDDLLITCPGFKKFADEKGEMSGFLLILAMVVSYETVLLTHKKEQT